MARPWTEGKGIANLQAMKHHRRANQRDILIFIAISVVLMLIVDQFIFGGKRSYHDKIREQYYKEHPDERPQPAPAVAPESVPEVVPDDASQAPPGVTDPAPEEHGALDLPDPEPDYRDLPPPAPIFPLHDQTFASLNPPPVVAAPQGEIKVASLPFVPPPDGANGRGKIAIIIDDVGMNVKNSRAVMALPGSITLAFLPYAPQVRDMAKAAIAAGHEAMIHVPMEAVGSNSGLGPLALRSGMDAATLNAQLEKMFASFDGYKGINNHMGSKLTQDAGAMDVVMAALRARDLYFIDSKTIGNSVAGARARYAGVPHAERDVFLDHEETSAFVAAALARTERLAHVNGYAIAIGHPKDVTIEGLRKWIPTLKDKGLELVPASMVLMRPSNMAVAADKSATQPAGALPPAPAPQPAPLP